MARTDPQVNIRLPAELLRRLEETATHNQRSFRSEIVARLDASLATPSLADQLAAVEATVRALAARIEEHPAP